MDYANDDGAALPADLQATEADFSQLAIGRSVLYRQNLILEYSDGFFKADTVLPEI